MLRKVKGKGRLKFSLLESLLNIQLFVRSSLRASLNIRKKDRANVFRTGWVMFFPKSLVACFVPSVKQKLESRLFLLSHLPWL